MSVELTGNEERTVNLEGEMTVFKWGVMLVGHQEVDKALYTKSVF
jgi:hypothetical protein